MNENQKIGKVILAGAGPGDPDLISLKAVKALRQADVVILDRLVSSEIIEEHVSSEALVIYAGKQAGNRDAHRPVDESHTVPGSDHE